MKIPDYSDNGDGEPIDIPSHKEVCPRCRGEGHHDHEAFSNGLTQADFAEDPEFAEQYRRGLYNVPCSRCQGIRVIDVPDRERCSASQLAVVEAWEACQAASRAEARMRANGIEF